MPYRAGFRSQGSETLFGSESSRPSTYLIAHVDGGARGNPGPAGYGVVLTSSAGDPVAQLSDYLGHKTNNFAEYSGLIAALEYCEQHGCKALQVVSDSELMVKQMNGVYKVKSPELKQLFDRARQLVSKLDWFRIQHVLREKNRQADRLANAAMDRGMQRGNLSPAPPQPAQEFNGIVKGGVVHLLAGELPEGTMVRVRTKN